MASSASRHDMLLEPSSRGDGILECGAGASEALLLNMVQTARACFRKWVTVAFHVCGEGGDGASASSTQTKKGWLGCVYIDALTPERSHVFIFSQIAPKLQDDAPVKVKASVVFLRSVSSISVIENACSHCFSGILEPRQKKAAATGNGKEAAAMIASLIQNLKRRRIPFRTDNREGSEEVVILGGVATVGFPYNSLSCRSKNPVVLSRLRRIVEECGEPSLPWETAEVASVDEKSKRTKDKFSQPNVTKPGLGDHGVVTSDGSFSLTDDASRSRAVTVSSVRLGIYARYASEEFSKSVNKKGPKGGAKLPTSSSRRAKSTRIQRHEHAPKKYWLQRYRYFWRFDEGIRLDRELWFSVTPESIAEHVAERCRCNVIVDAFAGAGGNAIQFAFTCERVIAIEIDPSKLELARCNAKVYGVEDRIEFILGDCTSVLPALAACGRAIDCVFLAPPWGGPAYSESRTFDVTNITLRRVNGSQVNGIDLLSIAQNVAPNTAYMLPKNVDPLQYARTTSCTVDSKARCEIERHCVKRGRVKTCAAYHGQLFTDIVV